MKLFKKINKDKIKSITCGEINKNGFANIYVNNKKTNVKMLLWDKSEIIKLQNLIK